MHTRVQASWTPRRGLPATALRVFNLLILILLARFRNACWHTAKLWKILWKLLHPWASDSCRLAHAAAPHTAFVLLYQTENKVDTRAAALWVISHPALVSTWAAIRNLHKLTAHENQTVNSPATETPASPAPRELFLPPNQLVLCEINRSRRAASEAGTSACNRMWPSRNSELSTRPQA